MGARQTFFGALAFRDAASLDASLSEVLGPEVLGQVPQHVGDTLRASRKDAVLFVSQDVDAPSSWWHPFVGAYHELAARALRGRVAMLYRGDGTEVSVAVAGDRDPRILPPGSVPTRRFLALEPPTARVLRLPDAPPLELDVIRRVDGTLALDVLDWLGFFGVLFERDETLVFETERGDVFEWARPDQAGSCRVVSLPTSELIVVVEVLGRQPLALAGAPPEDAIAITLHRLRVGSSEHDYGPGWQARCHARATVWLSPGRGLVAFG